MQLLARVQTIALIATSVAAGCSNSQPTSHGQGKPAGSVALALQPVSGVTLNSVHYVATRTGSITPLLEGDLPTPGLGKVFAVGLPIPVGTGYVLSLSGVSVENASITCAGSVGPFDVQPNLTTNLSMKLLCTDATNALGNNNVTIVTDTCPRVIVDYLIAAPNSAITPSGKIAMASKARELDNKALTFAWTVENALGTFAPANTASSTFTCVGFAHNVGVTLTASNGECSTAVSTLVSCIDFTCGNGTLDPGEACDPSIPVGQRGFGPCLPNCNLAVCGNGVVEPPIEQCDPVPADPANCTATCQTRSECGDGFLSVGEACDGTLFPSGTAPGSKCSANCTLSPAAPVCGNGFKDPPEVCDPKFTVNNCGADCLSITSAACFACENDASTCQDFVSCDIAVGNAAAGSPAAGTPKANLCNEVLDCVRKTGCAANGNAPINCYCGTASGAACQAGLGNGVCKTQIERGLETTAFTSITSRFKNTAFGGGVALARIDCDQNACKTQCGL